MTSPMVIYDAGMKTLPISWVPKTSLSLTRNSKVNYGMCHWNLEVFVPFRVLIVGNDTSARQCGLQGHHLDVRVARDDPPVMLYFSVVGAIMAVHGKTFPHDQKI
ncbi:hypothetical protein Nepgr_025419 [Nepenthes gracilis]|uniref:Uncharacterized protein n=1 Tax=Nepenthes gracilis TaxID=150966 RepID=A0AAD3T6P2_NEPGR|nr:hypothetical protein Nepgr_025419 [Nepenthes gracilis]